MIAYERTTLNNYEVWVTNQFGREPLGKLKRDGEGQWYYEPLSGSYLYIGALLHVVMKLDELNGAAEMEDAVGDIPRKKAGGSFEVI